MKPRTFGDACAGLRESRISIRNMIADYDWEIKVSDNPQLVKSRKADRNTFQEKLDKINKDLKFAESIDPDTELPLNLDWKGGE